MQVTMHDVASMELHEVAKHRAQKLFNSFRRPHFVAHLPYGRTIDPLHHKRDLPSFAPIVVYMGDERQVCRATGQNMVPALYLLTMFSRHQGNHFDREAGVGGRFYRVVEAQKTAAADRPHLLISVM